MLAAAGRIPDRLRDLPHRPRIPRPRGRTLADGAPAPPLARAPDRELALVPGRRARPQALARSAWRPQPRQGEGNRPPRAVGSKVGPVRRGRRSPPVASSSSTCARPVSTGCPRPAATGRCAADPTGCSSACSTSGTRRSAPAPGPSRPRCDCVSRLRAAPPPSARPSACASLSPWTTTCTAVPAALRPPSAARAGHPPPPVAAPVAVAGALPGARVGGLRAADRVPARRRHPAAPGLALRAGERLRRVALRPLGRRGGRPRSRPSSRPAG